MNSKQNDHNELQLPPERSAHQHPLNFAQTSTEINKTKEPSSKASEVNIDWFREFNKKITHKRVPLMGTLELTSRCNLRCVHCYLGSQTEQHQKRSMEMSTEEVFTLIDEFVAAGTLNLLITGGDPMMRKDFKEVYRYAKKSGLLLTVFCDGVLITPEIVELFQKYPTRMVEISLYGATKETYEKVTQVKNSYEKCLRGIQRLIDGNVRVSLKTVLMTINQHELTQMEEIAEQWEIPFRFDSAIFPCIADGRKEPLNLRVPAKQAVDLEMSSPKRVEAWKKYYLRNKDKPTQETLYTCGAGVNSYYVDPFGGISPCVMTSQYKYDIRGSSFFERWHNDLPKLREKKPREGYGCNSCEMRSLCSGCPAFHFLENGEEDVKSDYVCKSTQLRYEKLLKSMKEDHKNKSISKQ